MRVVYDADRVVVVDKDAGVDSADVAAQLGKKLVHRIDKPTSGLLILADDARTVQRLQKQLQAGGIERRYRFAAHGVVSIGVKDALLVRDRGDGLRGIARPGHDEGAKPCRLEVVAVDVVESAVGPVSVGVARLVSGRTHQIRIQLAEAGHVLVGERVYDRDARAAGQALLPSPRLLLHAERLVFTHPGPGSSTADRSPDRKRSAIVDVSAAVPADFAAVVAAARADGDVSGRDRVNPHTNRPS